MSSCRYVHESHQTDSPTADIVLNERTLLDNSRPNKYVPNPLLSDGRHASSSSKETYCFASTSSNSFLFAGYAPPTRRHRPDRGTPHRCRPRSDMCIAQRYLTAGPGRNKSYSLEVSHQWNNGQSERKKSSVRWKTVSESPSAEYIQYATLFPRLIVVR